VVEELVERVDYTEYTNRQLVAIPLALLVVAVLVILGTFLLTGAPANLGIEFTGGTELQIETSDSQSEIEQAFDEEVDNVRPVATGENAYIVTFQSEDTDAIESQAEAAGFSIEGVNTISASFGEDTQVSALQGIVIAFVGMSVIVFAFYREIIPCVAVVVSAASDILVPLALMNIFDIPLTLGTVAALLMIIGYSVDSDILLTTHILRRSGSFYPSAYNAMRTGVTMTLTSLSAVFVMAIVAYAFGIGLLANIGIVLAFGLMTDLLNTYLMNVSLLRYHKGLNGEQ